MFCAIRKFENKKSTKGSSKRIEVYTSKYENEPLKYCYTYSREKFERPPKNSYQISIQHSYRENGKVQKKQWKVATLHYYDFIDPYFSWKKYVTPEELNKLLHELGLTLTQLEKMITTKLQPLINDIHLEWEQSAEFKVTQGINYLIEKHDQRKKIFEEKWGRDTYDFIYDVFGNLRNEDYFQWLNQKTNKKTTYAHNYRYKKSDHREKTSHNNPPTKKYDFANYSVAEKLWLKKFYRTLAKEYHPDISGDTEPMTLINKLKNEWDI